jgi:RNA polymerase sigma factor (sigma-70 family)
MGRVDCLTRAEATATASLAVMTEGLTELVSQARQGDQGAWEALVTRLQGVVWRVTADSGLATHDRSDVLATTFFRLLEHLGNIREPEKLPGWLATTARNEVKQLYRSRSRVELHDDLDRGQVTTTDLPGEALLAGELHAALRGALAELGRPCRELLRLVTAVPRLSYDEVGSTLGIPRGSIGPTRQRCLEQLRRSHQLRPFLKGALP